MRNSPKKFSVILDRASGSVTLCQQRCRWGHRIWKMTGMGKGEPSAPADEAPDQEKDDDIEASADPRSWGRWVRARRESIRRRPAAYRIYRIIVGILGGAIVVGGLALVPLPGPGWVIVFVGLALLATEFVWAERVEKFARDQVKAWTQWLGEQSLVVRILFGVLTFAFVAGVLYGLFALTGVPGWIPESWVPDLPGL
jgi:uncharacterized protein (TIGR02611 family)